MSRVLDIIQAVAVISLLGFAFFARLQGESLQHQAGIAVLAVGMGLALFAGKFPGEWRVPVAVVGLLLINIGGYAYYRDVN